MLSRVKNEKQQSARSAALVIAEKRGEIEKINLRLQKLLDSFLDEIIDRFSESKSGRTWQNESKLHPLAQAMVTRIDSFVTRMDGNSNFEQI